MMYLRWLKKKKSFNRKCFKAKENKSNKIKIWNNNKYRNASRKKKIVTHKGKKSPTSIRIFKDDTGRKKTVSIQVIFCKL